MHLKSSEWHSLSKASEILGNGTSYVSLWLRRHEKDMPEGMVIASGKSKLISDQGIEWIKKNAKKEGVLVSSKRAFEDKYLILPLLDKALNNYFTFFKNLSLLLIYSRVTLKVGR